MLVASKGILCHVMSATTFNKTSLGPQHKHHMEFMLCNNNYLSFDGSKKVFPGDSFEVFLSQLETESTYSFVSTCAFLRYHDIEFSDIH